MVWATSLPAVAEDLVLPDAGAAVTGVAWDDSGDRLFAVSEVHGASILIIDAAGEKRGNLDFSAQPESVQGLALHDGNLYVGDIGGDRDEITVFRMSAEAGEQKYRAYKFAYPDGSHDAKALLVSGKGRIYIVTAGENAGVYRAELELSRDGVNKLTRSADAPDGVTDATFLPDGATIIMRTAAGLAKVDAYSWETTATVSYVGAPEGESVTAKGEGAILVGAQTLREEEVPDGDTERVISAEASPTPSQSPAPPAESGAAPEPSQPAGETPPDQSQGAKPALGGTKLALAAAAALALCCGLVVLLRRN